MISALDILYHHATQNVSPHTTIHLARLALIRRESRTDPIVTLAKTLADILNTEMEVTITRPHPNRCIKPTQTFHLKI
jgi:hypothetical protein